jgi:APA family basic amino acid/polyamine antiporter
VRITIFTAIVTSAFAGIIPLAEIAALANAGTLAAFTAVCAAMLVLRQREPNRERLFKAPLPWLVGLGGIGGCIYLFLNLPWKTQEFFIIAQIVGLLIYFAYSGRAAEKARANG